LDGHEHPPASQKPPPLGQVWPQEPQLFGSVFGLSHDVGFALVGQPSDVGAAQVQVPLGQVDPAGQVCPQLPQLPVLFGFTQLGGVPAQRSVLVPVVRQVPTHVLVTLQATVPFVGVVTVAQETHMFAQSRSPEGQEPQLPPVQLAPAAHTVLQLPQWLVSVWRLISQPLVALLSQLAKPPLHEGTHTPPTQLGVLLTVLHTWPQPPQLFGSFVVFTHAPLPPGQLVGAVTGHVCPQVGGVPVQVAPPFDGALQGPHVNPHDERDVELSTTHVPLQLCVPPGHAQAPAWHVIPPAQTFPQAPQLLLSADSVVQMRLAPVPHMAWPVGQAHVPAVQTSLAAQAFPQPPQLAWSVAGLTQVIAVPHVMPPAMLAQAMQTPLTQV
jgi:hypothetical protein